MDLNSGARHHGIIPWLHDGNQWYFLTQVGYSASLYDFKVDPLRGKREGHETPWETAVREVKEESADLLDFSGLLLSGVEDLGMGPSDKNTFLFHVEVVASDDLVDLVRSFDVNHAHLSQRADLDERRQDDLLNHVGLVWTRLTDPRPVRRGNRTLEYMADAPHYRMGEEVWKMIKEKCQKSDSGKWCPPAFHATCKLQKIDMGAVISYKAVHVETSTSDSSSAITSFMVGHWKHSDGFLAENNREEWLWKCRRRQWDVYEEDRSKIRRLVEPWRMCTEAEFDMRMTLPLTEWASILPW